MKVTRTDIERVAGVIETWQRRHVGQLDADTGWAAQNLAIDLANAGEVTALPAPYAQPVEPGDNAVWEFPGEDHMMIEADDEGRVKSSGDPDWWLDVSADEAEALAAVLRAAAARARKMEAARFGEPYPQPKPGQ